MKDREMYLLVGLASYITWWTCVSGVSSDIRTGCVTTNMTVNYGTAKRKDNPLELSSAEVLLSGIPLQLDQIISVVCGPFSTTVSLGPLQISPTGTYVKLIQSVEITMLKNDLYNLEDLKKCIEYGNIGAAFKNSVESRFGKIKTHKATDVNFSSYGTKDVCCRKRICECSHGTCENYGSCTDTPAGFVCACRPGFSGKRCETVVEIPEDPTPTLPKELDRKVSVIVLFAFLCVEGILISVVAFYWQSNHGPSRLRRNSSGSFDSLQAVDT